jgi:hypothetical protein
LRRSCSSTRCYLPEHLGSTLLSQEFVYKGHVLSFSSFYPCFEARFFALFLIGGSFKPDTIVTAFSWTFSRVSISSNSNSFLWSG